MSELEWWGIGIGFGLRHMLWEHLCVLHELPPRYNKGGLAVRWYRCACNRSIECYGSVETVLAPPGNSKIFSSGVTVLLGPGLAIDGCGSSNPSSPCTRRTMTSWTLISYEQENHREVSNRSLWLEYPWMGLNIRLQITDCRGHVYSVKFKARPKSAKTESPLTSQVFRWHLTDMTIRHRCI